MSLVALHLRNLSLDNLSLTRESDIEFVKLPEMARSLGVFVYCGKQSCTTKQRLYRFSHLLIQEFVAALFMANYVVQTGSDLGEALMHVRCAEPQSMHICVFLLALIKDSAFASFLDSDDDGGLFRYLENGSKSSLLDASEMPQIHSALSSCMDHQVRDLFHIGCKSAGLNHYSALENKRQVLVRLKAFLTCYS